MKSDWLVVSNFALPPLDGLGESHRLGDIYVYTRYSGVVPNDVFTLDVDRGVAVPGHWPQTEPTQTTVQVDSDRVEIHTGVTNTSPVWRIESRREQRVAFTTDLFLAPVILAQLSQPLEISADPVRGASIDHTVRLDHNVHALLHRDSDGWSLTQTLRADPVRQLLTERSDEDATQAGETVLETLEQVLAVEVGDHRSAACMLSGGVDSGAVACLLTQLSIDVHPISVGTPWGDEFDQTRELTDHLNLRLTTVTPDLDGLRRGIVEAIRFHANATPFYVDAAVLPTVLLHHDITTPLLFTGYGNDYISGGVYRQVSPDDLTRAMLEAVDRTRDTNEFSNLSARSAHIRRVHPYWSWPVLSACLRVDSQQKIAAERGKYFLRAALARRVPQHVAWRPKIAMHQGGGLERGLTEMIDRDSGGTLSKPLLYRNILASLAALAAAGQLESIDDPLDVYRRAVHDDAVASRTA